MITCPSCGTENQTEAQFCHHCGKPLSATVTAPTADTTPSLAAPQPAYPVVSQPYQYAPRPPKDRSLALILEILPGLFGFLGFGWLYSGNTSAGIAWLVGVLVWDVIAIIIIAVSAGFGCFCTIPMNLALVALSAYFLNDHTKKHPELFGA